MRKKFACLAVVLGGAAWVQACGSDEEPVISPVDDAGIEAAKPIPRPDSALPPADDAGSDVATPDAADAGPEGGPEGGTTLDGGTCNGGTLAVTGLSPQFGTKTEKTAITVTGSGFLATPKVFLRTAGGVLTQLTNVRFFSSSSLSGDAPINLEAGDYDVVVTNPGDCAGVLAGSFKVSAEPAPIVLSVTPTSGTTQADVPVTITGCNFPPTATLSTVDDARNDVAHSINIAPAPGAIDPRCNGAPLYTMTGTIQVKTKSLTADVYQIRVKNPIRATFGDYASFVVSNPSGKLGAWKPSPSLVTARRSLGLVAGRVDDARRFVYAVAGENAAGTPLKTVEVAPVDRFGQLGAWFVAKNELVAARSGLTVARQGKYLYAFGGTGSTGGTGGTAPTGTPIGSIERALILDPSGSPKSNDPVVTAGGGTLAKGTFYYKVAAILGTSDPATQGETIASDEVVATLSATGKVDLTWTAPAVGSVASYRVYRTTAVDGASGTEVLLKDNIEATTYTDTGGVSPGTEKPMALGSTGRWLLTTSLRHARLNSAAVIAADSLGARHVYVTGGWGKCSTATPNDGAMDCYEHATISDDGATLGATFNEGVLARPRMRHGAAVMSEETGPPNFAFNAGRGTAFVILGGGSGISTADNTVEYARVDAAGVLGAFTNPMGGGFATERDGTQFLIANGYGYALQGGMTPTSVQSVATVTQSTLSFPNWTNAGGNLVTKLGRHGATSESAFFYIAGGTTNDVGALATVYQILH